MISESENEVGRQFQIIHAYILYLFYLQPYSFVFDLIVLWEKL